MTKATYSEAKYMDEHLTETLDGKLVYDAHAQHRCPSSATHSDSTPARTPTQRPTTSVHRLDTTVFRE